VFRTLNGKERESIPIRFQTTDGGLALTSGRKYKATEPPAIPVAQKGRDVAHQDRAG
jgi:hypothetical protein